MIQNLAYYQTAYLELQCKPTFVVFLACCSFLLAVLSLSFHSGAKKQITEQQDDTININIIILKGVGMNFSILQKYFTSNKQSNKQN